MYDMFRKKSEDKEKETAPETEVDQLVDMPSAQGASLNDETRLA